MKRRFQHLEGQRPDREDGAAGTRSRFENLDVRDVAVQQEEDAAPVGNRIAERAAVLGTPQQRTHAEAATDLPSREAEVAGTVPAWRGEAFPEDVAADIRRQLGIPDPPPPEAQQQRGPAGFGELFDGGGTFQKLLLGVGVYFAARRLFAMIATVVVFLLLLATGFLTRGCAVVTGSGY